MQLTVQGPAPQITDAPRQALDPWQVTTHSLSSGHRSVESRQLEAPLHKRSQGQPDGHCPESPSQPETPQSRRQRPPSHESHSGGQVPSPGEPGESHASGPVSEPSDAEVEVESAALVDEGPIVPVPGGVPVVSEEPEVAVGSVDVADAAPSQSGLG